MNRRLRQAIINWRQVQQTLKEMQHLSREVLFATVSHPPRRKRLGKKVLGLIEGPFGIDPFTQLDVFDAETSLTQVRTTNVLALHDYATARAKLERAIGEDMVQSGAA